MKHLLLRFIAVALFVSSAQAEICSTASLNGKYAVGSHGKNFDVAGMGRAFVVRNRIQQLAKSVIEENGSMKQLNETTGSRIERARH